MSKIMEIGANIGEQAAQGLIDNTLGMAMQPLKNKMQLKQQGKLQALQIKGQKELSDYQQQQQMQMWKDTNYSAQVNELKKAGLNPSLIYGMKGGGGVTTGAGSQTGVTGGQAQISQGMGMQMMTLAQVENIKAQTENLRADTKEKLEGRLPNWGAQTTNLLEQAKTEKEKRTLIQLQQDEQRFTNRLNNASYDKQLAMIEWRADEAFEDLQNARRNNDIGEELYQLSIQTKKAEYAELIANISYTKQKTGESKATTTAIETEERMNIKRTIQGLEQKWQEILNQGSKDISKLKETNEYSILEGILGTAGAMAVMKLLEKSPQMIKGFTIKK